MSGGYAAYPGSETEIDDAAIIRQSCRDPDRFAAIFDRHFDEIYRYVERRLGASMAEDITGDTFLIAFRKRSAYESLRPDARPWLYGIATRLMHRHRRTEIRKYRAMQRIGLPPAEENHDDRVTAVAAAQSTRQQLGKALAGLRTGDRNVLLLVAWEELSYEEVADALGVPIGTVRSRLNRARRRVREAFGGSDPTLALEETNLG